MQHRHLVIKFCLAILLWTVVPDSAAAQLLLPSQQPPSTAVAVGLPAASPAVDQEQGQIDQGELPTILSNINIFTTALGVFAEVADNVTGSALGDILANNATKVTLLVPTDEAIVRAWDDKFFAPPSLVPRHVPMFVANVFLYHLIPEIMTSANITRLASFGFPLSVPALNAAFENLIVSKSPAGDVTILGGNGTSARVIFPDVVLNTPELRQGSEGVEMHVIDNVLKPPGIVVDVGEFIAVGQVLTAAIALAAQLQTGPVFNGSVASEAASYAFEMLALGRNPMLY